MARLRVCLRDLCIFIVVAAYCCCFHSSGMARFASRLSSLARPLSLWASALLAATQAEHQEQRRLLPNVVVTQSTPVVELLAGEDEALLIGRHALLVLDRLLDVVDGVARVHVEGDGATHESLDEDLHVEEVVCVACGCVEVVGFVCCWRMKMRERSAPSSLSVLGTLRWGGELFIGYGEEDSFNEMMSLLRP